MDGVGGLVAERSAAVAARASAVARVPGAGCRERGRVRMGAACSGRRARGRGSYEELRGTSQETWGRYGARRRAVVRMARWGAAGRVVVAVAPCP